MTARVFQEDAAWGLPSTCPACIAAQALLRFAKVPVTVEPGSASPAMTSANTLPVVVLDDENATVVAGFPALRSHVSTPTDVSLTRAQQAESLAFAAMATAALEPARLHAWYATDDNFTQVVRVAHAAGLVFPISALAPAARRRRARQRLEAVVPGAEADPDRTVFADAVECLRNLSVRLGDRKPYFYGDAPGALDALVYGHLALYLYTPLRTTRLRDMVTEFPNLVQLVNRIRKDSFPGDAPKVAGGGAAEDSKNGGAADPRASPSSTRQSRSNPATASTNTTAQAEPLSPEEALRRQRNRLFVALTVGSFLGYALFGTELEFEGLEFGSDYP